MITSKRWPTKLADRIADGDLLTVDSPKEESTSLENRTEKCGYLAELKIHTRRVKPL